jgi:hypothetical protein
MRSIFSLLLILSAISANSQKIYGTVFTETGDLLPFSSITVKGSSTGTSGNDKARFSFSLPKGTYTLVCQHIGYVSQEKKVTIDGDTEVTFILKEQKLTLDEVVVTSGGEDPAYEIIRQAIKKRNTYANQVKAFEVDLYAKDLIKLRNLPKKIFGQKIPDEDRKDMGLDSAGQGIIYLSESVAKIYAQEPNKFKMDVISSRVSGSGGFGFTFPTFISLYSNNVKIFSEGLNPRGFISPISDGAIGDYKFKLKGFFWEDGKMVNTIQVTPRRLYEPLFSGIINITEDDWRIHSFDLQLVKTAQLELLDTLKITQLHVPVNKTVWRVKNQLLYFNFKSFGIDAIGNFLNVYSNYDVAPSFTKKTFSNVLIKYDTAVNKRSIAYWDSIRPVPLETAEAKDYTVKDSIYQRNKDSIFSKFTVDTLNARRPKLKPYKVFLNGLNRTKYRTNKSSVTWGIRPLIPDLEYNLAEGITIRANGYVNTYIRKWKTAFSFEPHLRYGTSNGHLNAWGNIQFRTRDSEANKKIKQYSWDFAGGKRVSQFNKDIKMSPFINSFSTLLNGNNWMKTYENYFGSITYSKRFENGLRFTVNGLYENRIPLNNTTNFTFSKKDSIHITPNYPNEKIAEQFPQHQAAIVTAVVSFRPGQRYIQFPYSKVAIGSRYPTFNVSYSKGINGLFGSDVDFDKWKFSVNGDKNLKLMGEVKYNIGAGGFINNKKVYIQDFQHFNGNLSIAASEYLNSFQLVSLYGNSNVDRTFAFGHVEHHFNGLLTNKIPLFRKLNWNLVGGANAFYVNSNSNYVEAFIGLENILKVFRVDFVVAYENGLTGTTGIRIGTGGILGGSVNVNRSNNSASISF